MTSGAVGGARLGRRPDRWGWAECLCAVWGAATCSPRLHETLLPNTQWLALALLVLPVMLLRGGKAGVSAGRWPAAGLVAATLVAGWAGPEPLQAAIHAGKLALVWLLVYPVLYQRPRCAQAALSGVLAAVWLNAGLVALGAAGLDGAAGPSGAGRWRTFLALEGSLALVGVFGFTYAMARTLTAKKLLPGSLAHAAVGLGLALLDGSRAALGGAPIALLALVACLARDPEFHRALGRRTTRLALAALAVLCVWQALPRYDHPGLRSGVAGVHRIQRVAEAPRGASWLERIERLDPARYRAIERSFESIRERPLVGDGLGSTLAVGRNIDVTVHNALLQAWADLGLLGVLSYAALTLAWVFALPRFLDRARRARSDRKALCYGSLAALVYFNWSDLFQGVSVDASRWIFFLLPALFYWRLLAARPLPVARAAPTRSRSGFEPVVAGGRL